MFHFIITLFKNSSDMGETKLVLVLSSKTLLVAAIFYIHQVHTEKKVGYHSEIKSQNPCENEHKKFCFHGGECFYRVDQDTLSCNCIRLYGGKRCEHYM